MTGLPMVVSDIDAAWLAAALGERFPGTVVADVEIVEVLWGTGTKVLIRVTYAPGGSPHGIPSELCVKAGLDERSRKVLGGSGETFVLEAKFYGELAPELDVPLPRCWFAAANDDGSQGVVILDDLKAIGVTFGQPTEPWSPDLVAAALEVQAAWHAATWDRAGLAGHSWLRVGSPSVRGWTQVALSEEFYEQHFARTDVTPAPPLMQDRERFTRALHAMWARDDEDTLCLSHHDSHLGNTYVDPQGGPRFLDWQGVCLAPALDDVTYFLVGALTVADRRAHERDLLGHYLDALASRGGPSFSVDAKWLDYRRHHLKGLLWSLAPPNMQPAANVAAIVERYSAASEDHDTMASLLSD